jgi:hypothetical protein
MIRRCFFALCFLAACGNAEVVAPELLVVVDTYPGNGSLVAREETALVVTFSADIEESTLATSIALSRTTAGTVTPVSVAFTTYDAPSFTATYSSEPLDGSAEYALVIRASTLRAKSGATLRADVKRSFRTQ